MSSNRATLAVDTQGGEKRSSSKGVSDQSQDIASRATFAAKLATSLNSDSEVPLGEENGELPAEKVHSGSSVVASLDQAVKLTLLEARGNHKDACRSSDGEDSDSSNSDGDLREALETLQTSLCQGNNLATLAGLLTTNTFSMEDERIEELMGGAEVPLRVRQMVCNHIMTAIDEIWAQFGGLLVEKLGSFEKAFAWLDQDGSGSMDRSEFVVAYVTLHVDDVVEDAPRDRNLRRKSQRRATGARPLRLITGRQSIATMTSAPATRRNTEHGQQFDGKQDAKSDFKQDPNQLRRALLRADAEFLFHMLHTGERGLIYGDEDDADLTVSMEHLVMRVAGLSERTMEHLRESILVECSSLQGAFQEFTSGSKQQMTLEEFSKMYRRICRRPVNTRLSVLQFGEELAQRALTASSVDCLSNINEDGSDASPRGVNRPQDSDENLYRTACRIFKGIDLDGSGALSIDELRHALAAYAPATSFSTFRRRLLLQHSSFDQFVSQLSPGGICSPDELELFAFDLDLNSNDANLFAEKMGLVHRTMLGLDVYDHPEMPTDGFSVEELAIVLFLAKPDGSPPEDLFKKVGRAERDKDLSFREFTEHIGQIMQLKSMVSHATNASTYTKAQQRRGRTGEPKRAGRATISAAVPALATQRIEVQPACRTKELHVVYEQLERDHRRVTVNVLQAALTNISDVLAIDQGTYQPGSHIVCRVRLSADLQKRCRDKPFLAVVPERLKAFENGSSGGRTQWFLDDLQVVDFSRLGIRVYELPRNATGIPKRDSWLRVCVPPSLPCAERYEVRLFSSSNGVEPGKQVGRSVAFDLTMPRPEPPLVDTMILDTNTKQTSVVLHWEPPTGNFSNSPIKNFVVHVEPLLHRHEFVVDPRSFRRSSQTSLASSADENAFHQISVWSPKIKGFVKKLSYRVHGLHRGVPYKFGIQCAHGHPDDHEKVVRGGQSELCEEVAMPLFNTTSAPGIPSVIQLANGSMELSWSAPHNEDCDTCRIFQYVLQYRYVQDTDVADKLEAVDKEESDNDDNSRSSSDSGNDARNHAWTNIDEQEVFISQPGAGQQLAASHIIYCRIAELLPLETAGAGEHEFRVAALSNAGSSPWSKPSKPTSISTSHRVETMSPPPPHDLSALEVYGSKVHGNKYEARSHCLLRWTQPGNFAKLYGSPQYVIRIRNMTQDGDWVLASSFFLRTEDLCTQSDEAGRRRSSFTCRSSEIEAIVRGLERFPSEATLGIQVEVATAGGQACAEMVVVPAEVQPVPPLEAAPEIVRVHEPGEAPPIWELSWDAATKQDASELLRYVVQAQHSPTQNHPSWGEFYNVKNSCISDPNEEGDRVTCFIRHDGPDGLYRFQVQCLSTEGSLSRPSPVSAQTLGSYHDHMKRELSPKLKAQLLPKRPRELTVVSAQPGWCELSWEQRVPVGGAGPTKYFAEECWEDGQEASWRPVRCLYVSFDEALALVQGTECQIVRAAVFFEEDPVPERKPRWRVRVRAEGSEWSAPTQWQGMGGKDVPSQVADLTVSTMGDKFFLLEWVIPDGGSNGLQFDLHMQVQQNRRAGKSRDWAHVPGYIMSAPRLEQDGVSPACRMQAIVEKEKVIEYEKGGAMGEVRFRIRSRNSAGVAGLPSEASDWVNIRTILPSVPAPEDLRLVGHGRILVQGEEDGLCDSECVRLEWKIPDASLDGTELPDVSYTVEIANAENGLWDSVSQAFQKLDLDAGVGFATVVLHSSYSRDETCFRIAALPTPSSGDDGYALASYSEPCSFWCREKQQIPTSPMLSIVKPTFLSFRFLLPVLTAHISSSVIAEIQRLRSHDLMKSEASDTLEDEHTNREEHVRKVDVEYQSLGEHHVLWQLSSLLGSSTVQPGMAGSNQTEGDEVLCPCEGIVYLGDDARLTPGDQVCVRLRLCSSGVGQILQGEFGHTSPFALVVEDTFQNLGSLGIEYPGWSSLLPVGGNVCFEPRVVVGNETAISGFMLGDTEPTRKVAVAPPMLFQITHGRLPCGLELDPHSGIISGSPVDLQSLNCFSVQVSAATSGSAPGDTFILAGTKSSVTLACAAMEGVAHDILCDVLQDSVLQSLQVKHGIIDRLKMLLKPELLPLFTSIDARIEDSETFSTTIKMACRMFRLPAEVVTLAAELEEHIFIDRLCSCSETRSLASSESDSVGSERGEESDSDGSLNSDAIIVCSSARQEGQGDEAGPLDNGTIEKRVSGISGMHAPPPPLLQLQRCSTESLGFGNVGSLQELPDGPDALLMVKQQSEPVPKRRHGSSSSILASKRLSHGKLQETRRRSSRRTSGIDSPIAEKDDLSRHRRKSSCLGRKSALSVYGGSQGSCGGNSDPDIDSKLPRKHRRPCAEVGRRFRLEIQYPTLTPLWPAFADVEFLPSLKFISLNRSAAHEEPMYRSVGSACNDDISSLQPGQFKFAIDPSLPANVTLNEHTGVISGSPFIENVVGCQFTVTAYCTRSGDVVGSCSFGFAVVSSDLANLCNTAYLGHEPPAFLPPSIAAGMSHDGPSRWPSEDNGEETALHEALLQKSDLTISPTDFISDRARPALRSSTPSHFMVEATPRTHTPLDSYTALPATLWNRPSSSSEYRCPVRPSSSRAWIASRNRPVSRSAMTPRQTESPWRRRNSPAPTTPGIRSISRNWAIDSIVPKPRTSVFPLGPPLKDRDITAKMAFLAGQVAPMHLSAR